MLSKSVELRAIELIEKGMDAVEAVKKALIDEINFCSEMVEQKTERSKKALNQMQKNVYVKIHLNNCLQ